MKRTTARIAGTMAAFTLGATGLAALVATPAEAASVECKKTSKEFPTSGFNTDVTIELCVQRSWSSAADKYIYGAYVNSIKWTDGGGVRKFDKFTVVYRVEHNDADKASKSCGFAAKINDNSSDSGWCPDPAMAYAASRSNGWTADGYVSYNLDADGEGDKTWSLTGTPAIN